MTYRLGRLVEEELTSAGYVVTNRDGGSITSDAPVGFVYLVVQDCRRRLNLPTYADYVAWRTGRL